VRDLEGQNVLNQIAQKSTAVTVSQAEKEPMKPSLETLSPPQRNEVSSLNLDRVPDAGDSRTSRIKPP
jgi:hypothetical protein